MKRHGFPRLAMIAALLAAVLLLSGCDPNAGKRPTNYPNTVWRCGDPDITLYVKTGSEYLTAIREPCERDRATLTLRFDYGSGLHIQVKSASESESEDLFYGTCKFSPKELRVTVKEDRLFGGKYLGQVLVFTRSEWDGTLPADMTEQTEPQPSGQTPETEPTQEQTRSDPLPEALLAAWVNSGTYSSGRPYVETLTLFEDLTIRVHLDYEGEPYSDLTGTCFRQGDLLRFTMADGTVREYRFEVDGNILTLTGEDRTVTYRRSD